MEQEQKEVLSEQKNVGNLFAEIAILEKRAAQENFDSSTVRDNIQKLSHTVIKYVEWAIERCKREDDNMDYKNMIQLVNNLANCIFEYTSLENVLTVSDNIFISIELNKIVSARDELISLLSKPFAERTQRVEFCDTIRISGIGPFESHGEDEGKRFGNRIGRGFRH